MKTTILSVLLLAIVTTTSAAEPEASKPMMVSEAKLPAGFPAPGPVGEVIVKTYPAHRLARTAAAAGGDDRMFMRLFGHIKRNEIAMTAPVTMDWAGDPAEQGGPESMAFLYAEPDMGKAGPDPADAGVVVEDIPEATVASIGLRGGYGEKTFRKGAEQLAAWLAAHPEWEPAGPPRMLAYNSPFVPGLLKYSEIQRPIRPAPKPAADRTGVSDSGSQGRGPAGPSGP
jgi:hypothetical protein